MNDDVMMMMMMMMDEQRGRLNFESGVWPTAELRLLLSIFYSDQSHHPDFNFKASKKSPTTGEICRRFGENGTYVLFAFQLRVDMPSKR